MTIVVTANSGPLTNTATVSSSTDDPNTVNNSATSTTAVTQPVTHADLSITKSDAPDPVTAGQSLTYTLTVANGGPDAASGGSAERSLAGRGHVRLFGELERGQL